MKKIRQPAEISRASKFSNRPWLLALAHARTVMFGLLLLAALTMAACSSSSSTPAAPADVPITSAPTPGAGTSGDEYPGISTQATITNDNAQRLLMGTLELTPFAVEASHNLFPESAGEAQAVESGGEACDFGGTLTISAVSYNSTTSVFSATATFSNCLLDSDAPIVKSGSLGVEVGYKTSGNPAWLVTTFNDLVIEDQTGTPSLTFNGEVHSVEVAGGMTVTLNIDVEDEQNDVYRLEGVVASVIDDDTAQTSSLTLAGKFYAPGFGYVEVSTPETVVLSWSLGHPISGQVRIDGANGYLLLTAYSLPSYHFTVIGYGVTGFSDILDGSW